MRDDLELHALIHEDSDGSYWAEVQELPGCFASGQTLDEVTEALVEAVGLVLEDVPQEQVAALHATGMTLATA